MHDLQERTVLQGQLQLQSRTQLVGKYSSTSSPAELSVSSACTMSAVMLGLLPLTQASSASMTKNNNV